MNVSPRQLRMFLALTASLNFSRTAEQFFVTQPSLSKAIRDLEEELGLRLFERSTRSVKLTESGERLAALARGVIGEFDAGLERLRTSAERASKQLAIASLPSLANVLLPAACSALETRYGDPRITIHDCSNAASIQRLINGQVDFSVASVAPSHPDVRYEEILRDRFVLLSSARWHARVAERMHLDDLVELPLISMTDSSTAMRYMSAAYLQRGIEFRPKMQFDQVGTIAGFVKQGLGIAVLPYLGTTPLLTLRGLRVSEIVDGPVRSVGIVTRRAGTPTAIAQQAMQEVRTVAGALIARQSAWVLPPSARRTRPRSP
ncbi:MULTISPECIES: LysR family transcriptional regulator [unclassified Variovorax]|uniref:LysR family transcriptional regulator n=1 Tax=unclassified Variovorax TaxID=663243 RepID=UPI002577BDD4|nr:MULTISPECIES: LysR family transcriptional regulator [unclassified Variovorax]MDM0090550.1 LysR family transcriptional regulator [Variovorax sp. J22G40]MDM0147785.1 LysR family transcriptional regulator [Variovorax sp. J2P1-31]